MCYWEGAGLDAERAFAVGWGGDNILTGRSSQGVVTGMILAKSPPYWESSFSPLRRTRGCLFQPDSMVSFIVTFIFTFIKKPVLAEHCCAPGRGAAVLVYRKGVHGLLEDSLVYSIRVPGSSFDAALKAWHLVELWPPFRTHFGFQGRMLVKGVFPSYEKAHLPLPCAEISAPQNQLIWLLLVIIPEHHHIHPNSLNLDPNSVRMGYHFIEKGLSFGKCRQLVWEVGNHLWWPRPSFCFYASPPSSEQ